MTTPTVSTSLNNYGFNCLYGNDLFKIYNCRSNKHALNVVQLKHTLNVVQLKHTSNVVHVFYKHTLNVV